MKERFQSPAAVLSTQTKDSSSAAFLSELDTAAFPLAEAQGFIRGEPRLQAGSEQFC